MIAIAVLLYNLSIIALTTYMVAEYHWSAWWFVGALLLMLTYRDTSDPK